MRQFFGKAANGVIMGIPIWLLINVIVLAGCATIGGRPRKTSDFVCYEGKNTTSIAEYLGREKELVIPPKIRGKTVTGIGERAFAGLGLISVTIPDTVTVIGNSAFAGNQLTSIIIPDGVTSIGNAAFADNQLASIIIPDRVTTIGNSAFAGNRLTNVIIPDCVTTIGNSAFADNQLTNVTISGKVAKINNSTFANNQLTSVIIPGKVTEIGNYAFADNQLTSVSILGRVTKIGDHVFARSQLTNVTLPGGIKEIGYEALGEHTPIYIINERKAGTYTRKDDSWYVDNSYFFGGLLFVTLTPGTGIHVTEIDGASPDKWTVGGIYYLPFGQHTLTVGYRYGSAYSVGDVTFDFLMLGAYLIIGEQFVEGGKKQILFSVKEDDREIKPPALPSAYYEKAGVKTERVTEVPEISSASSLSLDLGTMYPLGPYFSSFGIEANLGYGAQYLSVPWDFRLLAKLGAGLAFGKYNTAKEFKDDGGQRIEVNNPTRTLTITLRAGMTAVWFPVDSFSIAIGGGIRGGFWQPADPRADGNHVVPVVPYMETSLMFFRKRWHEMYIPAGTGFGPYFEWYPYIPTEHSWKFGFGLRWGFEVKG